MNKRILLLAAASIVCIPVLAQAVPIPVVDVSAEPVWVQTLTQAVSSAQSMKQTVQIEVRNMIPTQYRWALNTTNPMATEPLLDSAVTTITQYQNRIQQNTGATPAPDPALAVAKQGMSEIPQDQSDIASAQAASDSAQGTLSAAQAGHRFDAMTVTNDTKTRQFLYAQYLKKSSDEMAATAWMTTPSVVAENY